MIFRNNEQKDQENQQKAKDMGSRLQALAEKRENNNKGSIVGS